MPHDEPQAPPPTQPALVTVDAAVVAQSVDAAAIEAVDAQLVAVGIADGDADGRRSQQRLEPPPLLGHLPQVAERFEVPFTLEFPDPELQAKVLPDYPAVSTTFKSRSRTAIFSAPVSALRTRRRSS